MVEQQHDQDVARMLSEAGYSDRAIRYFQTKENIGVLENADQITDLTGPCGDTMKVSLCIEGETIEDEHSLYLPRNLQSGSYSLVAGAYLLETMQRIPIRDHGGDPLPGDQAILVELELQTPSHRSFVPLFFSNNQE